MNQAGTGYEATRLDGQAHHCDVLNVSFEMNTEVVDPAGIRGNMPAGWQGRCSYLGRSP